MRLTKEGTNVTFLLVKQIVSKDVTFHEIVLYFTSLPQSQGGINDLEFEAKFLILCPSLPRAHTNVPNFEHESISVLGPQMVEPEPKSIILHGPSMSSILQELVHLAPTLVYQIRSTPDPLQGQIQLHELEVCIGIDFSITGSRIFYTCNTNLDNLPISLINDKR